MANIVTIDMETYYDKEYSLSRLTTEEYIRDPRFEVIGVSIKKNDSPAYWYPQPAVDAALSRIDWSSAMLVAHNAMFDGAILSWVYGFEPLIYCDTLSMARPHHGLTCGVSLKALAEEYKLGQKGDEVVAALGKRYKDFDEGELAKYGGYCCNDSNLTYELFMQLLKKTPKAEMLMIDQTMRLFCRPLLELDREVLVEHLLDVRAKKAKLLAGIDSVVGKDGLMSNDKLAEVLQQLGVQPPVKVSPKTGKEAWAFAKTDKGFTDLLEHDDPRVQAVVAARLGVKTTLEETRTERFIGIANRGALPVPLNYAGAVVTTRHSGGEKLNLQNLTRGGKMRKAIMAPEGHVCVVGDSSNIELRINHTLAGQAESIDAFRHGRDLYCEFASVLYRRPITKEQDPSARDVGKLSHLSLGYGAGAAKFREMCRQQKVRISEEEAEHIVGTWRETYDRVPAFWKRAQAAIEHMLTGREEVVDTCGLIRTGELRLLTPPQNQIYYPELQREGGGYVYRNRKQLVKLYGGKMVENICQHLARNIIAAQWLELSRFYPVVLQVHDELVMVVPEAEADDAKAMMEKVMSTSPAWWPELPLASEVHYAVRYGDAK